MKTVLPCLAAAAILAGCAPTERSAQTAPVAPAVDPVPEASSTGWRAVATPDDRARLRGWRDAWMTALLAATRAEPAKVRAQGALFDPDLALDRPMPPAGDYRCRVFKLGGQGPITLDYVEYPWFACRIGGGGDVRSFDKLTGSQRPVGRLFADDRGRAIFLGTLVLGNERVAMSYGQDAQRDMIGMVQRVGERRWRMAFPRPAFESQLDVIELVPA